MKILKLIFFVPVTNAVTERLLSAICRLFTYLGTRMGLNWLNKTMMLHIHKEGLDQHFWTNVANGFIDGRVHRKTLSGTFDSVNLQNNNVNVKSVGIQVNMNKS